MSIEKNKENTRRMVEEVMNGGNLDLIQELINQDYVLHTAMGQDYTGPDGLKRYFIEMHEAFPDIHNEVQDMIAEEDKVATRMVTTGTHKGTLTGIPPTGKQVRIPLAVIASYRNGKQAEVWQYYDALNILQQMGVAPPMEQAVKA